MPTVREIITAVREYCGNPPLGVLNLGTICLHLYDQIDHLLNRLNLTDESWILDRQTIGVDGSNDEYSLNANFGRAVMVETSDDGSPDYVRRELTIVDVQDFNLYWSGYKTSSLYGGVAQSAEVCAFFGLNNQSDKQIKFAPPPDQSTEYRVWYEIGRQPPPALAAKPLVMEQFHNLLKVATAVTCLPHCGYTSDEGIVFQQHMNMLQMQEAKFDEVFERYIHQNHHEDTGPRRGFNSSRSGGDYW